MITIVTPTYNREITLKELYKSLVNQTNSDFEWIVVDDGSTDNTENLFKKIINENNKFKITYKKIIHGGKHRAINFALQIAKGKMFFIVDSDDKLTEFAIDVIVRVENSIGWKEKNKFAGICGPRHFFSGKIIGSTFSNQKYLDITYFEREKFGIYGDKSEILYTHIFRKYKFPEFEGENFLTEAVVWDKIAADNLNFRYFNEIIYLCKYRKDGLSHNLNKNVVSSPLGESYFIRQRCKLLKLNNKRKFKLYFNYYKNLNNKYSLSKIAKFLKINKVLFFNIILICKLYSVISKKSRFKYEK